MTGSNRTRRGQAAFEEIELRISAYHDAGWMAQFVADLEGPLKASRRGSVDEGFAAFGPVARFLRVGRIRLPFGIYERGEADYSGFIEPALVKSEGVLGVHLLRSITGVEGRFSRPPYRVQATLMNDDPAGRFHLSARSGGAALRVERHAGSLLLGLNGYAGRIRGEEAGRATAVGVDWRWATSWMQLHGEGVRGGGGARGERGFHADLLLHPPGFASFTGFLRVESIRAGGHGRSRWTAGGRFRIARTPDATLAVNLYRDSPRAEERATVAEFQLLLLRVL